MNTIVKKRTIRPSTRKESSVNYRIDINKITPTDTLVVKIDHENKLFNKTFTFRGKDIVEKKGLSFTPIDYGTHIEIVWRSTQPISEL